MKAYALLMALLASGVARAELPTDKVAHAGVGLAVSLGTYGILKQGGVPRIPAAILGALAGGGLGVIKELSDRRFDPGDVIATTGGALLGTGMVWAFDF